PRVEAEEAFVDAKLGLAPEAVVDTRKDDDEGIASVDRLADERGVVRSLSGLDVADDEAASVPSTGRLGVSKSIKDVVGHAVELDERTAGPSLASIHPMPIPLPELELAIFTRCLDPGNELLVVN